ncbi:MAG: hypothetical protein HYR51_02100 [Candidatus Rokubacteria bacterium]|nr:hypothetical protein [Candidatus Rokubacteria bacterium]
MRDTVNVIREGVPAVALVHEPFAMLARLQVAQVGMPDAPVLIYARDLPDKEPADVVERKAHEVAERAAALLLAVSR